ncbi:sulfurtransferase [Vineibacter terrae]|uniref:Sulfurtransferase n=1 Tax=Vineibacter terrae TaxID=2586908 RepID=A0A5C8PMZ9_9HYPH|nr:rhodanese-like domain-containing protein [Vineibacter terrae]TXL75180.1 sulfurtransferase [Vineibacter terrae]
MMDEIDVGTLARMRREGAAHTVLDVREPQEVAICAIADSLCIPMQQIPQALAQLPRQAPLVVLCHHGVRSARVTAYLRHNGLDNATNLAGGIDAWARLVETDMPRY